MREQLLPALETLVQQVEPEGLWLFGSWARGTTSRRSDVDLLVMGLEHCRVLDAYDAVLEALQSCWLPLQPRPMSLESARQRPRLWLLQAKDDLRAARLLDTLYDPRAIRMPAECEPTAAGDTPPPATTP